MLQRSAEDAAYLHFLAKCHEMDILMEISNPDSASNQMNRQVRKRTEAENRDAINDIFNYSARFNAVPIVRFEKSTQYHRGRKRDMFKTTVDLDEQDIHVISHGPTPDAAEVEAAQKFKLQAEKFQLARGGEALVIKDSSALTIDHTKNFMDFMKIVRPGIQIEVRTKELSRFVSAQGYVNEEPIGPEVHLFSGKKAKEIALFVACLELEQQDPALWPRFTRALQYGNGQILQPLAPLDMAVDEDCALMMRETLLGARRAGLPDDVPHVMPANPAGRLGRSRNFQSCNDTQINERTELLKTQLQRYSQDPENAEMRGKREELPMSQYRSQVLSQVNTNEYSVIVGATGSGKTTQVPQILLDDAIENDRGGHCNVICTQPRRIAATSVARRVAAERAEHLQQSVGYIVRFDSKPPQPAGSICYCTTGILLQQLQHTPDEIMDNVSHIVVDEVHERDIMIDFLLILLKKNVHRRKLQGKHNPKVVLMSATIDTELFADYFAIEGVSEQHVPCPTLSVPGRTFPVRERYLDEILNEMSAAKTPMNVIQTDLFSQDYLSAERDHQREKKLPTDDHENTEVDRAVIDWKKARTDSSYGQVDFVRDKLTGLIPYGIVTATVAHVARTTEEGAILVFLPGREEINRVSEELQRTDLGVKLSDESRFHMHILHSDIPSDKQSLVFEPVPAGCRKIILATNIAETSVTIPDVQHVVDTGKLREKQYDPSRRITSLVCTWTSKSNSKQRAGRAGRVQNGNYYALYTKERYDSFRAIGLPELLRSDLQETCLDVKAQRFEMPIRDFLAAAIEPPNAANVDASIFNLQALDALAENEEITPLGRLLANLPVHPSLGKMVILGIIFRCLDPMLVLGAASTERAIFTSPLEARAQANAAKLSFVQGSGSDHIALLNAVRELRHWRHTHGEHSMRHFAQKSFLHANSFRTIENISEQIEAQLVEAKLIPYTPPSRRLDFQYGDPALNENSQKVPLIKALNLAGLNPNLAVSPYGSPLFRTPGEKNTMVHPSSTNSVQRTKSFRPGKMDMDKEPRKSKIFTYGTLARSNDGHALLLRETTETTPLQACLFGGKISQNNARPSILEMDEWLPFYIKSRDRYAAKIVLEFRKGLERLLMRTFNDLGDIARSNHRRGVEPQYLADDPVRQHFAQGLTEVLDRDVAPSNLSRSRGWRRADR